jgi:hypothetical protein
MTRKREHSRASGEQNYVAGLVERKGTNVVIFFARRKTALKEEGLSTRRESAKIKEIGGAIAT